MTTISNQISNQINQLFSVCFQNAGKYMHNLQKIIILPGVFFLLTLVLTLSTPGFLNAADLENEGCFDCHDEVEADQFAESIHGDYLCVECHTDIKSMDHPETLNPVNCGECHEDTVNEFIESDHGKAMAEFTEETERRLCSHCHEENSHYILPQDNEGSRIHKKNIADACGSCHESDQFIEKMPSYRHFHAFKSYAESIHGRALIKDGNMDSATCSDCHGSHSNQKPMHPESRMNPLNISETCGSCHAKESEEFEKSKHAQALREGKRDAPLCTTCHGEHNIFSSTDKKSTISKSNISTSCGSCHASERIASKFNLPADRISTFASSFHGVSSKFGDLEAADCASCHGAHSILPSTDPDSKVHPNNLVETCGECHKGAGERLTQGKVHVDPKNTHDGIEYWVEMTYIYLIVFTIGFMFIHNFLDFQKHFREHYKRTKMESGFNRLNKSERWQHIVLAVTFIGLAITGFALAYPESIFALPFRLWEGGMELRYWLHRIFAIANIGLSFYHIYYALFTEKGRKEVPGFLPKMQDLKDLIGLMAYNLGLRKKRPMFGHHNYIEKAEYLALIWGTIVMSVTGGILMFNSFFIQYLPLYLLNVATIIHLYEAILATLAIIVWHWYFVIFSPSVFPMNWTWRTGKVTVEHAKEFHGKMLEGEDH